MTQKSIWTQGDAIAKVGKGQQSQNLLQFRVRTIFGLQDGGHLAFSGRIHGFERTKSVLFLVGGKHIEGFFFWSRFLEHSNA